MSNIHVLAGAGLNVYTVVVHMNVPAGNNAAGTAWKTAIVNAGLNRTILTTGNGPGQISSADAALIASGDLYEGSFVWGNDPAWSNAQRQADLDLRATQLQAELSAMLQNQLRYFGFTR